MPSPSNSSITKASPVVGSSDASPTPAPSPRYDDVYAVDLSLDIQGLSRDSFEGKAAQHLFEKWVSHVWDGSVKTRRSRLLQPNEASEGVLVRFLSTSFLSGDVQRVHFQVILPPTMKKESLDSILQSFLKDLQSPEELKNLAAELNLETAIGTGGVLTSAGSRVEGFVNGDPVGPSPAIVEAVRSGGNDDEVPEFERHLPSQDC